MQITLLSVTVESVKTAKGGYKKAEVAYKDESNKVQGKKIMSFTNPKVFDFITVQPAGTVLDIKSEKDDAGYWQWTAAEIATGGNTASQAVPTEPADKGYTAPKNNYETPEERAKKQIYIVRQSSITNAIALTAQLPDFFKKSTNIPADIIEVAKQFEAFVFGAEEKAPIDNDNFPGDEKEVI